ncbi:MAG: choline dehydrogenase, partial [Coriobacteriia bacterium]|nr:choline dehydrogenase [Coriobacteriia bacterium]
MKTAIVIGSGAGGCAAASALCNDFEVTILETGKAFEPFARKLSTFEAPRRAGLFLDERMIQLLFPAMRIQKASSGLVHVNGRCVGGTTALATGNALRYDRFLAELGIDLDEEFAELAEEVPMTQEHYGRWSDLTVRLFEAFEALGFDPQVTPKFMEDPKRCVACGRCVLGCRYGAKWTADRLLEGHSHIQVRTGCSVESIDIEGAVSR